MNKQNSFSNKTIEALKMALEALETPSVSRGDPRLKAINACKKALERQEQDSLRWANAVIDAYKDGYEAHRVESQEQEPVAWIKQGMDGYPKLVFNGKFKYESIAAKWDDIALYTKEKNHD